MIKETSRQSYESIQDDLGNKQMEVLKVFIAQGIPLTNEEVKDILGWEINRITPRVGELEKLGFIKVVGEKRTKSNRWAETRALKDYHITIFDVIENS